MTAASRRLRRDLTQPEQALWRIVRNRRLCGSKFRRQFAIDPYVVDFYCHEVRLAVELDGMSHLGTGDADDKRQRFLERQGVGVIRFTNDDVLQHPEAVADAILRAVRGRSEPRGDSGAPSPGRRSRPTSPGGRGVQ